MRPQVVPEVACRPLRQKVVTTRRRVADAGTKSDRSDRGNRQVQVTGASLPQPAVP